MPGEGNAMPFEINELTEKLKNEKDPVERAKLEEAIKELREMQARSSGRKD